MIEKNQKYISLAEAAEICSYSQEYLSLRARQHKLQAIKMGRNWFTTREWLDEYISKNAIDDKKSLKIALPAEDERKRGFLDEPSQAKISKLRAFWGEGQRKTILAEKERHSGKLLEGKRIWLYINNILQRDVRFAFRAFYKPGKQLAGFYKKKISPALLLWRLRISGFWRYQFAFPAKEYVFAGPPRGSFRKILALILLNILAFGGVAIAGFDKLTFAEAQRAFENAMAEVGKVAVAVVS